MLAFMDEIDPDVIKPFFLAIYTLQPIPPIININISLLMLPACLCMDLLFLIITPLMDLPWS